MTGSDRAGVTPAGIRDGRPEVLRGLVAARGSAVLAYCRAVCAPEDAGRAAAEAFARFRAAVVDAPDVSAIDPDALLLGATRHAAASLARTSRTVGRSGRKDDTCAAVPGLLAARTAGFLGDEEATRLDAHLERCPACRGLAEDFDEAEEAYRTATSVPIPPPTERMVLAALEAAAPVVPGEPDVASEPAPLEPDPVEPEPDPAPFAPEPEPVEAEPDPFEPEVETDVVGPTPVAEDLPAAVDPPPLVPDEPEDDLEPAALVDDEPEHVLDDVPAHDPFYDGPLHHDDEDDHLDEVPEPHPGILHTSGATASRMPRLPRPSMPSVSRPRMPRRGPGAGGGPDRDLRPVLLPALVVLAALVVFLAASGVFGGDDEGEPARTRPQTPELRVEKPVTTPLPVEVEEPPPATTPEPQATTPAPDAGATTPIDPAATTTTPPADGTGTTPSQDTPVP